MAAISSQRQYSSNSWGRNFWGSWRGRGRGLQLRSDRKLKTTGSETNLQQLSVVGRIAIRCVTSKKYKFGKLKTAALCAGEWSAEVKHPPEESRSRKVTKIDSSVNVENSVEIVKYVCENIVSCQLNPRVCTPKILGVNDKNDPMLIDTGSSLNCEWRICRPRYYGAGDYYIGYGHTSRHNRKMWL